jgi:SAM-dependent methyltransferase
VRNLPADVPAGQFDLIVASDVLYYWTKADVRAAVQWFEKALTPGGVLIAAHYLPHWGVILNGEEAHDILEETTTLQHPHSERVDFGSGRPYRVDVYKKA